EMARRLPALVYDRSEHDGEMAPSPRNVLLTILVGLCALVRHVRFVVRMWGLKAQTVGGRSRVPVTKSLLYFPMIALKLVSAVAILRVKGIWIWSIKGIGTSLRQHRRTRFLGCRRCVGSDREGRCEGGSYDQRIRGSREGLGSHEGLPPSM